MLSVASRSERARWITALTYKERQWQGLTNKGGECGVCRIAALGTAGLSRWQATHGFPGVLCLGTGPCM